MRQRLEGLVRDLLLNNAESDPEFSASIGRASLLSLRMIGALEAAVPLLMLTAGLAAVPIPLEESGARIPNLLLAVLGITTMVAGWTPPGRRWPRLLTCVSVWLSGAILIGSDLAVADRVDWVHQHILGYLTLVMFGAAAAVPLKPVHTLVLGVSLDTFYLAYLLIAAEQREQYGGLRISHQVFVLAITLVCTVLTASVYRQRYRNFRAQQQALRASEELRETQSRLLISDNAAVMGRVAAALSHELNSPVGVLASAVETLSSLAPRIAAAPPAERERLLEVAADLNRSGRQSTQRLREIVARIQRFANLDRAEVQSANLNDLIADVVSLVGSERGTALNIKLELQEIPKFVCRPQQLSAVFSNLLTNALDAVNGAGEVRVSTTLAGPDIEVRFEDAGPGIPPEQVPLIFDPGAFRVSQGRMAAGHWSLFSCRQIVREHGGEIDLSTGAGGTTVRVILPRHQRPVA